jgi:hypothetical protein
VQAWKSSNAVLAAKVATALYFCPCAAALLCQARLHMQATYFFPIFYHAYLLRDITGLDGAPESTHQQLASSMADEPAHLALPG